MAILVIEESTGLPYLLAFQTLPTHGSQTKSLGLTLMTNFLGEQTSGPPGDFALSRMPS